MGFQTLIGILQTEICAEGLAARRRVSNPYRYSTNRTRLFGIKFSGKVSNPYRYSTNENFKEGIDFGIEVSNPYRYSTNSLNTSACSANALKFQTLIGILQTKHIHAIAPSRHHVSNPYRYSTNKL